MYKRIINPLKSNSFFLFGARGTGKSSLLADLFPRNSHLWIDLLDPDTETLYSTNPSRLSQTIAARSAVEWVVIDEIQKAPKLLDVVHREIEGRQVKFALTGSSARKLKRGGANLLAGRAFVNNLYPLTHAELGDDFDLDEVLRWGSLPKIRHLATDVEREEFLKAYVNTYLKEEILQEQLVRDAVPFRRFLPIAAQMSGKILNLNSIATDLGVDWTTVRTYFEILEDTWLGIMLPAFHRSLRKQQLKASKFYLFDLGVQRTLDRTIKIDDPTSQIRGPLFEQFIVLELFRLSDYLRRDFQFSYIATQGGLEIDLVIERPGLAPVLAEIKSTSQVRDEHLRHLQTLGEEFPEFELMCICQEPSPRKVGRVRVLPWQMAIAEL